MGRTSTERQRRKEKLADETRTIAMFRDKGEMIRPYLKQVGCDLCFYDFMDSWEEEFHRTAALAYQQFPSLLGIHEVSYQEFTEKHWPSLGYGDLKQVLFEMDDRYETYAVSNPAANLQGSASFFHDPAGGFRSVILVMKNPDCGFVHDEFKYAFKIATLLHELGHVDDMERRLNIDPAGPRIDALETEVYANCYALDSIAERHLRQTYILVYDAFEKVANETSFVGDIVRRVIAQHPRRSLVNWTDHMDAATDLLLGREPSIN